MPFNSLTHQHYESSVKTQRTQESFDFSNLSEFFLSNTDPLIQ